MNRSAHVSPSPTRGHRRASLVVAAFTAVAAAVILAAPAAAQVPPDGTVRRPVDAPAGPVVVPDRFLRRWDPVTIFFDRDVGRPAGTPEDHPEEFVRCEPSQPGAFMWLDSRTLQFRPADPWTPLARSTWTVGGRRTVLHTLIPAPVRTLPQADTTGLEPVDAVTLVFPEPIAARDLAAMVTLELRPLPGIGAGEARWLTAEDFEVKTLERSAPDAEAGFVLNLDQPIPLGTRAVVHLRLSLDDDSDRSFTTFAFATAEPFRVVSVGVGSTRYPVTRDGTTYPADQAIDGGSDRRLVTVEFSSPPVAVGPVEARQLVRLTPAVDGLEAHWRGRLLEIDGNFRWDTIYRVGVYPVPLVDNDGRPLEMRGPSEVSVFFPRRPAYLRLGRGEGMAELHGPRMVPVEGRGHDRFDLRIFPVDPLDRDFWPFPEDPVTVDESQRPPGPGETPADITGDQLVNMWGLRQRLAALGAPPVSTMVELPLEHDGGSASFGLDLAPYLRRLTADGTPGHYLIGIRPLDAGSVRQWMRLQVTDLSLTAVEEASAARLVVTSLATGRPVAGAEIRIEGSKSDSWMVLAEGTTDGDGRLGVPARFCDRCRVQRLVVRHGRDVLVLDPSRPPDGFQDNTWSETYETWLQWLMRDPDGRVAEPEPVSHIFTERPVYRPEEEVHLKGYVRLRDRGRLRRLDLTDTFVVVQGPGDLVWRYPVDLTAEGSFHHDFMEADRPTGIYTAYLEGRRKNGMITSRSVDFRLEAYRLPRFQIDLHGPDRASLDAEIEIGLTATYYAGGRVADRPVAWRVTQFPHTWRPPGLDGFFLSSDSRFSNQARFEATAALEREDRTDAEGSARLSLDPAAEATAQPRVYVVEATVTGADDQTVTATRRIVALPPFVLGLSVPRYLEHATVLEPQVVVLDGDGTPLAGTEVTVRLLHRQWHSYLQASDFSDGEARYVTDVVDDEVSTTTVTSLAEPLTLELPIAEAGVYVVELEARDRIGRTQTVAVDLYAGGDAPVTWSKPAGRVLEVTTDADRYDPGDIATFVLESPFQHARVLTVVEAPSGNRYGWLDVRDGRATFSLEVEPDWTPRLPVHFVLMRGRVAGTAPIPGSTTDLGKPATLAATSWLEVTPRANRLEVTLEHPERALPGQTVDVTVRLSDPDGRPLAGEVTLWLVDAAVLALGTEQRLDPLPDLITPVYSRVTIRDTRDMVFGALPFTLNPGGGEAEAKEGILDLATVRRNFQPVPFYDPLIQVGPDGIAVVKVQLPDNLTVFKLRAKAVSGMERFGFAASQIAVRLPLIVQPALPRFVRPGDRFTATAIGRVVEGEGGPGAAEIAVEGVRLLGEARQEVGWVPNLPRRIETEVEVPTPDADEGMVPEVNEAVFRVGVERLSDHATDAFEVRLPVRDDREPITRRVLVDMAPGEPVALPPVEGVARPGTVRRTVLVSAQPAVVRMAAGLSFLLHYPHGCTEQRMSRARAWIGLRELRDVLLLEGGEAEVKRSVNGVLEWIPQVVDGRDLVSYWPGSDGYVSLTAWTVQFLVEARDAGFTVDDALLDRLLASLERALRSDYSHFIDGEAFAERCWALLALTRAGRFNPAYAAELSRKARFLDLESTAQVLQSFVLADAGGEGTVDDLVQRMWDGVVVRLYQGREVYGGLQGMAARSGLILPSETRTVAEVTRALQLADASAPRVGVLVDGLVRLGQGDGWGSTQADASALLALADTVMTAPAGFGRRRLELHGDDGASRSLELSVDRPTVGMRLDSEGPVEAVWVDGSPGDAQIALRAETSWMPAEPGSQVAAEGRGFVVTREQLEIVTEAGVPPLRTALDQPGLELELSVGDVVEDRVQVVNPADRFYVAVVVPLAAGMEPLNPNLATAPPEATPSRGLTLRPSSAQYLDDRVAFYYDSLPKGTYDFVFRTRATIAGRFQQPPAMAEMMYDGAVRGNGNGALVVITSRPE